MRTFAATVVLLLLGATSATAQEAIDTTAGPSAKAPEIGFVEAFGGYGFQFGEQSYVPTGNGTTYKHPLTNGYAVGASAGWQFIPELALMANWEYAASNSRNGSVANALDKVEGTIDYHTVALGLRWTHAVGPGRVFGELGAGLILPFQTKLAYDYASAMQAVNVTGSGAMIDEYNLGFGAYGQAGYQWDVTRDFYIGTSLRVKSFQSDNNGKQTKFENFVPDMTAPSAVNTTITYETSGANPPRTYSVQDLRFQLALGFRL